MMRKKVTYCVASKPNYYPITYQQSTRAKAIKEAESWFKAYPEYRQEYVIVKTTKEIVR